MIRTLFASLSGILTGLILIDTANASIQVVDCLDVSKIESIAQEGISRGISCLRGLKTKTSEDHLARIQGKISNPNTPYQITCSSKDTISPNGQIGSGSAKMNGSSMWLYEGHATPSIVFHELFHSIGYEHFERAEYAYACEVCCIAAGEQEASFKAIACKICSSSYDNPNRNYQYLTDMNQLTVEAHRSRSFKSPASAVTPLPQWIEMLAHNPGNHLVLEGFLNNLNTGLDNMSAAVSILLLEEVLHEDPSSSFRNMYDSDLLKRYREIWNNLKQISEFKSQAETLKNILYTCYKGDKTNSNQHIKQWYQLYPTSFNRYDLTTYSSLNKLRYCYQQKKTTPPQEVAPEQKPPRECTKYVRAEVCDWLEKHFIKRNK